MSKEFESQVGLVSASAKVVREKTISEIIEIIEGERADEMSASEGNETVELSANLWSRLRGSHKPTWIAAEIYNQALDTIKSKLKTKKELKNE